jgi:uncharacterized damage-inducible protein DinB
MSVAAAARDKLRGELEEIPVIKDTLLAEFDQETATTRKLIERVPHDRLAWKPHEKSMSLGGLALHLANLPTWAATIFEQTSYDLATAPPNLPEPSSAADIAQHFARTVGAARIALDKPDAAFVEHWTLKRGGQEIFTMPRIAAFRSFVMSHLIHHRGQLSVYLRLNDVPVPSIYGPSADESF